MTNARFAMAILDAIDIDDMDVPVVSLGALSGCIRLEWTREKTAMSLVFREPGTFEYQMRVGVGMPDECRVEGHCGASGLIRLKELFDAWRQS